MKVGSTQSDRPSTGRGFSTPPSAWDSGAFRGSEVINDDVIDIVAVVVAIVLVTLIALAF